MNCVAWKHGEEPYVRYLFSWLLIETEFVLKVWPMYLLVALAGGQIYDSFFFLFEKWFLSLSSRTDSRLSGSPRTSENLFQHLDLWSLKLLMSTFLVLEQEVLLLEVSIYNIALKPLNIFVIVICLCIDINILNLDHTCPIRKLSFLTKYNNIIVNQLFCRWKKSVI